MNSIAHFPNRKPIPKAQPTEFDLIAEKIPRDRWSRSVKLRHWIHENAHRRYVPEWLLVTMEISVNEDRLLNDDGRRRR